LTEMGTVDPDFWRGRRVLVTGHTGFKGAWLTLWLHWMRAECVGVSLPPPHTVPSLFDLIDLGKDVRSRSCDIRNAQALEAVLAAERPEVVIHLAARSLVRESYLEPTVTFATNVMGTANLLAAARGTPGIRAIVVVTSDKCYLNHDSEQAHRETDPLGGADPYSASKACAELVVSSFRQSFFPPGSWQDHRVGVASARAGNVIGGGDWAADRLIPDLVRSFHAGKLATIRSPGAVRPWQHVLDCLSGYLLLAQRLVEDAAPDASSAWNFGPAETNGRTVEWIADRAVDLWGEGAGWAPVPATGPHEATHLRLDSSKAGDELGWKPTWNVEEALVRTVGWYRSWSQGSGRDQLVEATITDLVDFTDAQ
jgi:CDP-glucose 4,6-dehydratase